MLSPLGCDCGISSSTSRVQCPAPDSFAVWFFSPNLTPDFLQVFAVLAYDFLVLPSSLCPRVSLVVTRCIVAFPTYSSGTTVVLCSIYIDFASFLYGGALLTSWSVIEPSTSGFPPKGVPFYVQYIIVQDMRHVHTEGSLRPGNFMAWSLTPVSGTSALSFSSSLTRDAVANIERSFHGHFGGIVPS